MSKNSVISLKEKVFEAAKNALEHEAAFFIDARESPRIVTDNGIDFEFRTFNFNLKSLPKPNEKPQKDPLLPPFDDYLFVGNIFRRNIIINKFMIEIGHVVISSENPNDTQGMQLDLDDFQAISYFMNEFNCGICYYNCGEKSGCSQGHKHIQYAPLDHLPLLTAMKEGKALPYEYKSIPLTDYSPKAIEDAYLELIKFYSHDNNFIVGQGCAVIVPRREARNRVNLLVNCLGVCGILFELPESKVDVKPFQLLYDVCVPLLNQPPNLPN